MDINRRTILTGGVAAAAVAPAAAQAQAQTPHGAPTKPLTLVNVAARDVLSLDGDWRYSIDPYRDGAAGFHGEQAGYGHRRYDTFNVEATMRANPNALIEYDMELSPTANLPSSWLTHEPTLRRYVGLMWYKRTFTLSGAAGKRAFVHVGAANYATTVFVNGTQIGAHEGGFTPFAFEIPAALVREGENQITLGVDSEATWDTVPPRVTDWENYGGITRGVHIVLTPQTFIDDAWIRLTREGRVAATVRLNGARARNAEVRVRIAALGLTLHGRTDGDGVWTGEAAAPRNLERWSPDRPQLYAVRVETAGDTLRERVGFRTIETRGDQILLNGEPIFLRGICIHEEELGAEPSRIITPENARALLTLAKEGLGCNFVRLAHYPHSEITTRLADELGLLVWSEIPVYWRINWENPRTLETARAMLAENIRRDRNRAAIALWSIGNETPLGEARLRFLAQLAADVRALDDTRLVTAALLTERRTQDGKPLMVLNDPLAEHLDVLGVNTYNGWYSNDALADVPGIAWRSDYGKPMIFSEFGADAKSGFHDAEGTHKFSEEFQAEYYRRTLEMAAKVPFLRGMSPWILKDFRSPRRQHPVYQQGWNRKGLVSPTGGRKQAFAVLAEHYRARAAN
ncbi:MAG TPA: glycoside hydrolase family 2 TIM barrel-domain containing protein [Caulobacterales bacterium]|nr:glycoside hydrolase family 2 TIM barrel-domain containing protein [Caulobacterales bacterium]